MLGSASNPWNISRLASFPRHGLAVASRLGRALRAEASLLDVFLRGTIMYLLIFVLLRLVVRRQVGGIGITDILVIVLIAEVTGNGISDNVQWIGESAILVCTILLWSTLIEWLQSRYPAFERLVHDPKL